MAKTTFSTSNNLTKKLWEEKLFRDAVKESYFANFMGRTSSAVCQTNEALTKSQGDKVTFGIRMRLAGAGVTSGQALEGNEENLTTYDFSVSLEEYAHAVRDAGPLDRQRAMFSIDEESEMALKDWMTEKIDSLLFTSLLGTSTKIFYKTSSGVTSTGTANTAKTALTSADSKLTPAMISAIRAWAVTGGNRGQTPLRPVRIDGRDYFLLLVHPDVMYDLKVDSTFAQARRDAEVRGKENPIFSNASAIWDGVIIQEHENVTTATDGGGASVPWATCSFMGAQALVWAWGERPKVVQKDFDYDREHGYAISMIAKAGKPSFNSKDYGSVAVYLARTNIAGL